MENDRLKIGKYLLWLLLISLIVFRHFTSRPVYKNGDTVRITTTVLSDPINYSTTQYFKIAGLKIYLPAFPEIFYGDFIVVEGIVNNGKLDSAKLISIGEGKSLGSGLRNKIIAFYQKSLPQPMSGLTAGVVLGSKGSLTSDFWNAVKKVGVAHVVVASGTNVTFVVSFLFGVVTLFLPRRKAIPVCLLGIILYLFVSGFEAPLIRAAIMAGVTFLGQETGRLISASRNLFLTAVIMLIYRPEWITDIGFILSFVSTASIMLFEKRIRNWLRGVPEIFKEGFSTSFAAQIGVAPILFVTFGQFSIWSPLVNALILWTVPYIMILGGLGGAVGLIWPFLGKTILFLSYPLLWWFTKVVIIFNF
jgi:competence protein ComEC